MGRETVCVLVREGVWVTGCSRVKQSEAGRETGIQRGSLGCVGGGGEGVRQTILLGSPGVSAKSRIKGVTGVG